MNRPLRLARSAALATALVAMFPTQAGERWRVEVPTEGNEHPTVYPLAPLLDGGYLLAQRDSGTANWVTRWDARDRLVAGPVAGPGSNALHPSSAGAVLDYGSASTGFSRVDPALACRNAGGIFGLPFPRFGIDYGVSIAGSVDLPASAVHFGMLIVDAAAGERSLVAFDAYCSRRTLRPLGTAEVAMLPARDGLSLFVHDREEGQLLRIGLQGELWSLPMPTETRLFGTAANGDVLLRDAIAVRRIAESGEERWAWPLLSARYPVVHAGELGEATVLLESATSSAPNTSASQRITVLDSAGAVSVQRDLQGERLSSPIRTLRGERLWKAYSDGAAGSFSPFRVVRVGQDAQLQTIANIAGGDRVEFELTDGSLLALDSRTQQYVRLPADGGTPTPILGAEVPARRELLDMVSAAEGAVIASRLGTSEIEILRVGENGALRWRRVLGSPMASEDGEVVLAANNDRVCALRAVSAAPAMTCLALVDGTDQLPAFAFPLNLRLQRPGLRLSEAGAMRVVGELCEPSSSPEGQPCTQRRLAMGSLDNMGILQDTEVLSDRTNDWLWSPSGRLVQWQRPAGASLELEVFTRDAEGRQLGAFRVERGLRVMALSSADETLALVSGGTGGTALSHRRLDGSEAWRRGIGAREAPAGALSLEGGDWLYSAGIWDFTLLREATVVERINGEDGTTRWRRLLASNQSSTLTRDKLDEARQTLWLSPSRESGGRIISLDLRTGEADDAAVVSLPGQLETLYLSTPRLVLDAGRPVVAWVDQQTQSLRAAAFNLPRTEAAQPGHEAGIWHAEDTDGQGVLLQAFDAGETLAGAWFTFSRKGGHADSEQRWFAVQGTREVDGGFAFSLFSAQGGAFAAPPSVEALAVGNGQFVQTGCDTALFTYHFTEGELQDSAGAIPLRRTAGSAVNCESSISASAKQTTDLTGSYFNPGSDGQGVLLHEIDSDAGPLLTGAWFTFDPEGMADDPTAQHWFTALGPKSDGTASELSLFRTLGGAFDTSATYNTRPVGTLSVEARDCAIRLRWRFDDSLAAGAFAASEGEQVLRRIGDCAAASTER